ncbi:MAG: hypothetical protein VYC39_12885 [Myxococcota bacterium]|nr:hypothetical protein [Myxococcota bacterium]
MFAKSRIVLFLILIGCFALLATSCNDSDERNVTPSTNEDAGQQPSTDAGQSANNSTPQPCTSSSTEPGGCECSNEPGFTTYSFEHQGQQRCLTTYIDPQNPSEALPLIIEPDCYTSNGLQSPGLMQPARRYGFRHMQLTSPDGDWAFPQNNEVNDSNYQTQCDESSTKEIGYLKSVFTIVDKMIADGVVASDKVFVSGFSQNSMYTLFMATCFPEEINGIWQGGSGLFSKDEGAKALPNCEGACTRSAFLEHGTECRLIEPCTNCQYFPVLPEKTGRAIKSCIVMYENDGAAHSTAVPGYKVLKAQGHKPQLYIFGADRSISLGDHEEPVNSWAWLSSCLGLHDACSTECSSQVIGCINNFRMNFRDRQGQPYSFDNPDHRQIATFEYDECLMRHANLCERGCSATTEMLHLFETPKCECAPEDASCDCMTSDVPGQCE